MNRAKVQADGRLTLPKKFVEGCGLSPQQYVDLKDVELRKDGKSKRVFLRFLRDAGVAFIFAVVAEKFKPLQILGYDPDADHALLARLFGVGQGNSGALVPAANHPFRDPPGGALWYPTEGQNCTSYKGRFIPDYVLRETTKEPQIMPNDGIVLFGSQVSNLRTREYFGNWLRESPLLKVGTRNWQVTLHWNLYTPEPTPTMLRKQFGEEWITWSHRFGGISKHEQFESVSRGLDLQDDYLLVTVLPRGGAGPQRIVAFAGLHGPAQKATNILLSQPPIEVLRKIETKIGNEPYYQALFHVPLRKGDDGEFVPRSIELIEARKLTPNFS
jgi:hypothetical protein